MSIGSNIRTARKAKNLTQKALAEQIGKSLRIYQKYEEGSVTPPYDVLQRIADTLEVPVQELFPWREPTIEEHNRIFGKYTGLAGNSLGLADETIAQLRLVSAHAAGTVYAGGIRSEYQRIIDAQNIILKDRGLMAAIAEYLFTPIRGTSEVSYSPSDEEDSKWFESQLSREERMSFYSSIIMSKLADLWLKLNIDPSPSLDD